MVLFSFFFQDYLAKYGYGIFAKAAPVNRMFAALTLDPKITMIKKFQKMVGIKQTGTCIKQGWGVGVVAEL